MTIDSTLPSRTCVHELGVGDLLARRRWARGWARGGRARRRRASTHIVQRGQLPGRRSPSPSPPPPGASAAGRRTALLTAAAARRRRRRRRWQVAHGSMLRPAGQARPSRRSRIPSPSSGSTAGAAGLLLFAAVLSRGPGGSRATAPGRAAPSGRRSTLTYEYGRSQRLARRAARRARPPRLRPLRRATPPACRCPHGWHLDDRRRRAAADARRARRLTANRRASAPRCTSDRTMPLAWADVRGELAVAVAVARIAGRRVDVPVAVVTWVGRLRRRPDRCRSAIVARVAGPTTSTTSRSRPCSPASPRRGSPTSSACGWRPQRAGIRRLRRGLPAALRARRPRRRCRSACSPSSSLVPLVYLPLSRAVAGHVHRRRALRERREARRPGRAAATMVLLVLMVCVGAPIVEELVYRGLLQGSFAARFDAGRSRARRGGVVRLDPLPPGRVPRACSSFGLVVGAVPAASPAASACRSRPTSRFNVTGLLLALR